jgi:integrase
MIQQFDLHRMVAKRAKILSHSHVEDLLVFARQTRHPIRNQVLVLLSVKAGLRAGEIANLTWPMLVEPSGEIGTSLELQDRIAKKGSGRVIPIHPQLRGLGQAGTPNPRTRGLGYSVQARRSNDPGQHRVLVRQSVTELVWKTAHPIRVGGPSLPGKQDSPTRRAAHSGTSSCSQAIGPC